jgi:hypothetical protein
LNRDIRPLPIRPADRAALAESGGGIVRFIAGVDQTPRPMTAAEIDDLLNDPLAVLLLRRGVFPSTLAEVLAGIDAFNTLPEGLPEQQTFLVGEGSQIRRTPETAARRDHSWTVSPDHAWEKRTMAKVMMAVGTAGRSPSVEDIKRQFNLDDDEIDPDFGVVEIDPDAHLYTVLVEEQASTKIQPTRESKDCAVRPARRG